MRIKWLTVWFLTAWMLVSGSAFAADAGNSTAAYRVKPIQEKLASLTEKEIAQSISKYSDLKKHGAASSIGKLVCIGIMSGYGNGTIKPDRAVTVSEFIVMTVRALGFKPESGANNSAQPFIDIAKEQKLIGKKEFTSYTRPIRREQAARIAVNALMLYETAPSTSVYNYIRAKIKDYPSIGDTYKQSVLQAYAIGILSGGSGGLFRPSGNLTRAEAATIIIRSLDAGLRKPLKPDKSEVLILKDNTGKAYEIYPTDRPELFQTAVALNENVSRTKGFGMMDYNPYDQLISASFYESKAAADESDLNIQLIFTIYPADTKNEDPTYVITVCDPKRTKALHMEFVTNVFRNLFEKDADTALSRFAKYTNLSAKPESALEESFSMNNRKVIFYKVTGHESFTVRVFLRT